MKKMKKLLSMLLAVVMVLAMAAPSFAAPNIESPANGSITVKNATVGQTYKIYKLFEANPSGSEDLIAYKTTATKVQLLMGDKFDATADELNDGYFTFTKINTNDNSATVMYNVALAKGNDNKQLKTDAQIIAYLNSFFELTKITPEGDEASQKVTWTVKEGYEALFDVPEDYADGVTAENQTVQFTNLEYGYYFVASALGATLTITSTNTSAEIVDKNQEPHWNDDDNKKIIGVTDQDNITYKNPVTEATANYGDTIKFRVRFEATNYAKTGTNSDDPNEVKRIDTYRLVDTLDPGMTYVPNGNTNKPLIESVKVGDVIVQPKSDTSPYGYSLSDIQEIGDATPKSHRFGIAIPWVNEKGEFLYSGNSVQTIEVIYSATVNTNAVIDGNGNLNHAKFSYWFEGTTPEEPEDPKKDPSKESEEKTTVTYTYALAINKVSSDLKRLSGAKFKVYSVALNTDGSEQLNEIHVVATDVPGVYEYVPADTTDALTEVESPQVDSGDGTTGLIVIKGLRDRKYKIEETEAPAGYNKLTELLEVNAVKATEKRTETKFVTYKDEDGNILTTEVTESTSENDLITDAKVPVMSFAVENVAGTLLPSTGGIGTTIFYAVGIILMAGAVFFVVRKRRA